MDEKEISERRKEIREAMRKLPRYIKPKGGRKYLGCTLDNDVVVKITQRAKELNIFRSSLVNEYLLSAYLQDVYGQINVKTPDKNEGKQGD